MNNQLDTLLAQHRELRALAGTYRAELDRTQPDLAALGTCRWTLARLISTHLAHEASHLYPTLRRASPQAIAAGERFASEIGQLTEALGRHVREWTVARIEDDWRGYRKASQDLIAKLSARMDKEEAELYPLFREAMAA